MFSSSDEHVVEAVYKKHGFDTAVDILLYSTPESDTKAVSNSSCIVCYVTMLHVFKAYCVCRSNCRTLPLYAIKLTKARAIRILPDRSYAMNFAIEVTFKAMSMYLQTH